MRSGRDDAATLTQRDDGTSGLMGRRVLSWRQWDAYGAGVYDRGVGEGTWRSGQHRLVLSLTPSLPLALQVDGGPAQQVTPVSGLVSFYPAGLAIRTAGTDSRFAHVCWDPGLHDAVAPDLSLRLQAHPELIFPDALLSQLMHTLAEEIRDGDLDRLLADSLIAALVMRVAQRFGVPAPARPPALPHPKLRRVLDYIDAHLARELTLAELAGVACLSPSHFSRAFKQAVGAGPHRYTVRRRVERAKDLLRGADDTLAGIAAATGFADQSHFTAAFRREVGLTPGRFRANSGRTAIP
ncbi:MAG TPA: AraC family transcriptional regulator [Acetobacteraceae bacterium]